MTALATASVLSIGTELTRGEIQNTNATWLAERLTAIGLEVRSTLTVADDAPTITAALVRLSQESDVVAVTGGLGPTTDDITSATVAAWLGVQQRRDDAVLSGLRQRLERLGRPLTASNAQQADFPEGAEILENPNGTAPGFRVQSARAQLFFMPGVPREMRPMFDRFVAPRARARVRGAQHQVRLRLFGLPESVVNDKLVGLEAARGVRVAYRAHFPEIEVKLLAQAATPEAARSLAEAAAGDARQRLGSAVYAEGDVDLPHAIGDLLRERQLTLSLAESCTGGLVGSLVTRHPASDFFIGGVVSYANSVKIHQLGVDPALLESKGAVSPEVAVQMADGARRAFGSDLALSLTGIAGPTGATPEKPVGLVYYALSTRSATLIREVNVSERPREGVQLYAAWCGLNLIREHLIGAG